MTIERIYLPDGTFHSHIHGEWCGVHISCIAHNHMLAIEKAHNKVKAFVNNID